MDKKELPGWRQFGQFKRYDVRRKKRWDNRASQLDALKKLYAAKVKEVRGGQ